MDENFKNKLIEVGTDYANTLCRFMNREDLYEKFLYKFIDDVNFEGLKVNLENKNYEEAFKCAHTLKGVTANLGLESIHKVLEPLVEELRNKNIINQDRVNDDFISVSEKYQEIYNIITNH